jgi:phage gp45-like
MFAASRNESVRGRTSTLVDSIRTRNGFSQSGAPSGRKCAVVFLGAYRNLEMIILSHSGNPIVRVMIR